MLSSQNSQIENHLFDDLEPEKFHWLKLVGQGSFGKVYKCIYDTNQEKFYAIKRFVLNKIHSKKTHEKILEINVEMNNLNKLKSHPLKPSSIPEYYGYYIEIDKFNEVNYCLVFEFLPKVLRGLLTQLNNKHEILEFTKFQHYFEELLYGLTYLQTIELSHRDLKPEIMAFDDQGVLKIIDFGFAKDISELINRINTEFIPTKFEMTMGGTVPYMAPEVIRSILNLRPEPINAYKTDVFAFGLIVLEMATLKFINHKKDLQKLEDGIESSLKLFKENYHELKGNDKKSCKKIREFVKLCLELDEKKRPDFLQLFHNYLNFAKCKEKTILHILVERMEEEEIKDLSESLNSLEGYDLKKALTEKDEEAEQLKRDLEKTKSKAERYKTKFNKEKIDKEDKNNKQKENESLEKEIEELKKKNEKLTWGLQKSKENEEFLNKKLKECFNTRENLQSQETILKNQLRDYEKMIESINSKEKAKELLSAIEVRKF